MIDFRYHLVSIIAVFLALAVGLVVGSTALSGKAEEALKVAQHNALSNNKSLEKERSALNSQVSADQAFAQAASQRLIGGLLAQEKIVLVVAPGADNAVTSGVAKALKQAGATVTGQVQLQQSFMTTSGSNETELTQLADRLAAQAGLAPLAQSQSKVAGQLAAAQVLAAGLLATAPGTGLSPKASTAILTGLGQTGFLSVNVNPPLPTATLAVLVTPGGPAPQDGSEVLSAVAADLSAAGSGTVMAGGTASVGAGSVISKENNAAKPVSTVDNADTETGQIMVAQALAYLLAGKPPTAYGIASGVAPAPAPTPSVTPRSPPQGPQEGTDEQPHRAVRRARRRRRTAVLRRPARQAAGRGANLEPHESSWRADHAARRASAGDRRDHGCGRWRRQHTGPDCAGRRWRGRRRFR